jgi:hypothetical protein
MVFRKYILGQCSKIILNNLPYKALGASTKKLFDDTYLYFMELSSKNINFNDISKTQFELMYVERDDNPGFSSLLMTGSHQDSYSNAYKHKTAVKDRFAKTITLFTKRGESVDITKDKISAFDSINDNEHIKIRQTNEASQT